MIEPIEALEIVLKSAKTRDTITLPLTEADNHVLAETITAAHDVPPFNNSAMDGYALLADDIVEASKGNPIELKLIAEQPAGESTDIKVTSGAAIKIMTGAPVPPGADTVVPIERTQPGDGHVGILVAHRRGANVRLAGEDMPKGSLVLEPGVVIEPVTIGLLASLGYAQVKVYGMPKVAIIGTGNELVPVDEPLTPGKIRDSNSYTLTAQTRAVGMPVERIGVAGDTKESVTALVNSALAVADVVVTSGGVSVGDYDFVKDVLKEMGAELKFWGVKQKPGKPLAFWTLGDKLIFGLPGNPVATVLCFEEYVRPALLKIAGRDRLLRPVVKAKLTHDVKKKPGRQHFVGVSVTNDGTEWLASVNGRQGSGILKSMAGANGVGLMPEDLSELKAGEEIDVQLIKLPEDH